MKIYLNGKLVDKADARVSVFDHGFLYGDGAFEGIRSYNARVFRLKAHIDRLYETMHTLMIDPRLTRKQMADVVVATLRANKIKDGYIRLIVSRGEGDLGLDPRKCHGRPNVICITDKITLYPKELYQQGMSIITVPTAKNHPNALNPQLKTLNYLNNILAKIEASHCGYNEAIMLEDNGYIGECTGDNVFIYKDGVLATPCAGRLKGITCDAILELAVKMKIKVFEGYITRHEMYNAQECFLTGTAAELIPIVKVDGRAIGEGRPGPVTRKLLDAFHQLTKKDGVKYSL
ncbi:MAG: branched-chain-amino-acid transaminase [Candidatus Omnitrophica bacterium]|nr:branched-chain-amino-acid transaminase [Candidatus Omnitrophota bacterium]MDE2008483.1 branched-chain-amino-acid transaminase [Candidatus Omnitrophota bacterium]MDE2215205.1 branched-chain-amino-acid transaminase [Candidatus Omnitrophota bacterium]MDE2231396.1 branched-chain-amino-acid transaminase [Candidatus Omnitrophota bacterium]